VKSCLHPLIEFLNTTRSRCLYTLLEQGVNLADVRMELAYLLEGHPPHQCQCALSVPIHEIGQAQFDPVDQDSVLIESRYMARK